MKDKTGIKTERTEISANKQRIEALEEENKVDKGRIKSLEAKIKGNVGAEAENTSERESIRGA